MKHQQNKSPKTPKPDVTPPSQIEPPIPRKEVISIQPGDVVVVHCSVDLHPDQKERIKEDLRRAFPNNKSIFAGESISLEVYRGPDDMGIITKHEQEMHREKDKADEKDIQDIKLPRGARIINNKEIDVSNCVDECSECRLFACLRRKAAYREQAKGGCTCDTDPQWQSVHGKQKCFKCGREQVKDVV